MAVQRSVIRTYYLKSSTLKLLRNATRSIIDQIQKTSTSKESDQFIIKALEDFIKENLYLNFFSQIDKDVKGPKIFINDYVIDNKIEILQPEICIKNIDENAYELELDEADFKKFIFLSDDKLSELNIEEEYLIFNRVFLLLEQIVYLITTFNQELFDTALREIKSLNAYNMRAFEGLKTKNDTVKNSFLNKINEIARSIASDGKVTKKAVYEKLGLPKSTFTDRIQNLNIDFDSQTGTFVDLDLENSNKN